MNERCPVCGLKFEREEGYFLGAMALSYSFSVVIILTFTFILWIFTRWSLGKTVIVAVLFFLPTVPALTLFSRVLWIYFDQTIDPAEG